MFSPKDYLVLEWSSISRILMETLRYRFDEPGSGYFQECVNRLDFWRFLLANVADDDNGALFNLERELDAISELISAIERSHLEEFSWPFAWALKRIMADVSDGLFFFCAEGGTGQYAIRS